MKCFIIIFQTLIFSFVSNYSFCQAGFLDHSFGDNGKVVTGIANISNSATRGALQSDGKIIVAGNVGYTGGHPYSQIGIVRYLQNGILDSVFGTNGKTQFFIDNNATASDLKVLDDDKILIASSIYEGDEDGFGIERFGLLRFTSSGKLDSSFGTNGIVKTTFPNEESASVASLVIQSDKKIVLSGTCNGRVALARYFPNGIIDSAFGNEGISLINFNLSALQVSSMVLQPDGKIVVCGSNYSDLIMARFLSSGVPDSSFGTNRIVDRNIQSTYPEPVFVSLRPNGNILIVASASSYPNYRILLTQYKSNGELDSSFGVNGTSFFDQFLQASALEILPGNKILIATRTAIDAKAILVMCNEDGFIDNSFGINGVSEFLSPSEYAHTIHDIVMQSENKILAIGVEENFFTEESSNFLMARYYNDVVLPIIFKSFTGIKKDNAVLLKWTMGNTIGNKFFEVEKSLNGSIFNKIAVVKNGYGKNYLYEDDHPLPGTNYYRLKQIGNNENYTYSSIMQIDFSETPVIKITPNPAQNTVTITGLGAPKNLSVADAGGRIICKSYSINDLYNLNIQQLPAGLYYLLIDEKEKRIASIKFVKQ